MTTTIHKLSHQLLEDGIVPQRGGQGHLCAQKYKAVPIQTYLCQDRDSHIKVWLSYGLGADSTALLLRWILEPESRVLADGTRFQLHEPGPRPRRRGAGRFARIIEPF